MLHNDHVAAWRHAATIYYSMRREESHQSRVSISCYTNQLLTGNFNYNSNLSKHHHTPLTLAHKINDARWCALTHKKKYQENLGNKTLAEAVKNWSFGRYIYIDSHSHRLLYSYTFQCHLLFWYLNMYLFPYATDKRTFADVS